MSLLCYHSEDLMSHKTARPKAKGELEIMIETEATVVLRKQRANEQEFNGMV
jgi:hypothetical protein